MDPKPIWESRTIWLNGVVAAILAIPQVSEVVPTEVQVLVMAVMNVIMRFVTKQPVKVL